MKKRALCYPPDMKKFVKNIHSKIANVGTELPDTPSIQFTPCNPPKKTCEKANFSELPYSHKYISREGILTTIHKKYTVLNNIKRNINCHHTTTKTEQNF